MKKVVYIILITIIISIFLLWKYYFYNNEQNLETKIVKNLIIVEKMWKIVKVWEEIFIENKNPSKLISNWFFIEKDIIITTSHSVWDYNDKYNIILKNWEVLEAKLIEKNKKKDLAKLKTEKIYKNFEEYKVSKNIKIWDKVFSYSYDLDTKKKQKKSGEIIKILKDKIYTNIKLKKGDSGSPLLDKNWNIIWVNIELDLKENLWISIEF